MTRYIADLNDFNNTLNNQPDNKLLIVCFTASWCGPCKRIMAPVCEKVAESNSNVTIVKVDVDDCEEVASLNDISCMPTLHFIRNKQVVYRLEGADTDMFHKLVTDYS